jgi:hypothetical protein
MLRSGSRTHQDRGEFEPADGAVHVRFVQEGLSPIPEAVALAGLSERFAVIQDTAVEGCADWYFDKLLWRCLVRYVVGQGGQVTVLGRWRDKSEVPIGDYLEAWARIDPHDQEPPWALFVRTDGRLALSMVTEYWCLAGGPEPYHDSYTYSLFSHRDLGEEVLRAIKGNPSAGRWRLEEEVIRISPEHARSSPVARHWLRSLMSRLRRGFSAGG